ncbi:MAG: YihY/virulence factor BrkB family protein [Lachnospiraceae bacterium]|nr:YihY/virulence factor BrkB family protein [Lachnospiraceae bacterium]
MLWKIFGNVKTFLDKCKVDNITAFAAQSAFFIILSTIPFLMVFSSLIKYTPVTQEILTQAVKNYMPSYISPLLISIIGEVYSQSFGLISIAAVAAIWSSAKGMQYLGVGLNVVNNCQETRNWFVLRFRAICYTLVLILSIVLVMVLLVFGSTLQRAAVHYLPLMSHFMSGLIGIRIVIVIGALTVFFALIFKMLPNRKATLKSQFPGAVLSAISWYAFSFALSVYVEYFNGFSTYGRLAAIVLVMLWVYFCMYILLLCAETNVVFFDLFLKWKRKIQERRAREKEL